MEIFHPFPAWTYSFHHTLVMKRRWAAPSERLVCKGRQMGSVPEAAATMERDGVNLPLPHS